MLWKSVFSLGAVECNRHRVFCEPFVPCGVKYVNDKRFNVEQQNQNFSGGFQGIYSEVEWRTPISQ